MITIISGTNRLGSNTRKVAHEYQRILTEKGTKSQFLSLEDLHSIKRDEAFEKIVNTHNGIYFSSARV